MDRALMDQAEPQQSSLGKRIRIPAVLAGISIMGLVATVEFRSLQGQIDRLRKNQPAVSETFLDEQPDMHGGGPYPTAEMTRYDSHDPGHCHSGAMYCCNSQFSCCNSCHNSQVRGICLNWWPDCDAGGEPPHMPNQAEVDRENREMEQEMHNFFGQMPGGPPSGGGSIGGMPMPGSPGDSPGGGGGGGGFPSFPGFPGGGGSTGGDFPGAGGGGFPSFPGFPGGR